MQTFLKKLLQDFKIDNVRIDNVGVCNVEMSVGAAEVWSLNFWKAKV